MRRFAEFWSGKVFSRKVKRKNRGRFDPSKPKDAPLSQSDPRIYADVTEGRRGFFETTPFVLANKGQEVAHKIQVQPLKLHGLAVTFESIDNIAPNEKKEVLPNIQDGNPLSLYNLTPLLQGEWNDRGQLTEELIIPVTVTYEDFAERTFEVNLEVVYLPITDLTQRTHFGEGLREMERVIKTRNTRFRVIRS